MSKEKEDVLVDVQEVYGKAEHYIEENQKTLSIVIGAIVLLVGGYFAWTKLYLEPMESDAQKDMFVAEQYFEKDSLNKAINGDGNYFGFKYIVDEYGATKSGNLAKYYLGMCYLKSGQFDQAIEQLSDFDSDDQLLGPMAAGGIGDAHMELGKTNEAIESYLDAAKQNSNKFTTPLFLMKAGLAYESANNYADAIKVYEQIKSEYPESTEGREIEKYLVRAKAMIAG